jgi:hypothetical protein
MPYTFPEFANNKRLQWIAREWDRYSIDLADWAMERLVNRRDVWGQYTLRDGEVGFITLPGRKQRALGSHMVTLNKLTHHFQAHSTADVISLHSISDHRTAKWFAIDIDLHDESIANADDQAAANLEAGLEWARRLREALFDPLFLDTNGVGGYHLWCLLDDEYPLADVYDYVSNLRSDFASFGLARKPEAFPPKREVEDDSLPYPLRVPGRHPRRPFYSRVRDFYGVSENDWLEGGEAIEAMLNIRPAPLPVSDKPKKELKKSTLSVNKGMPRQRPRVCVDLDGVLASYDKWRGLDHIGDPVEGALEFAKALDKKADIVIFTSRCSSERIEEEGSALSAGQLRIRIVEWLEKHGFPYADVYVGQGKPRAVAFIDDRSIACSPQRDPKAFDNALDSLKGLLRRSSL